VSRNHPSRSSPGAAREQYRTKSITASTTVAEGSLVSTALSSPVGVCSHPAVRVCVGRTTVRAARVESLARGPDAPSSVCVASRVRGKGGSCQGRRCSCRGLGPSPPAPSSPSRRSANQLGDAVIVTSTAAPRPHGEKEDPACSPRGPGSEQVSRGDDAPTTRGRSRTIPIRRCDRDCALSLPVRQKPLNRRHTFPVKPATLFLLNSHVRVKKKHNFSVIGIIT
jgi:hypothetical protein